MGELARGQERCGPEEVATRDDLRRELSALRHASGLTIREVAAAADVPFSTVGGYFSLRHLPTPLQTEQFVKILRVCGVTDPGQIQQWLDAVRRVRRRLGRPSPSEPAPYRGLESFQTEHADWFFGRETLTQTLVEQVTGGSARRGPLMVVGPSGSGKSSLLRAGLMSALQCPDPPGEVPRRWGCVLMTPGTRPLESLSRQIHESADASAETSADGSTADREADPGSDRLVLIVDQFEEVFTLCQDDAERQSFIERLHALAAGEDGDGFDTGARVPARVVIGMRADFYPHALKNPLLAAALQNTQVVVGPMTETDLRQAIAEPARKAKVDLDSGLMELLVRELKPVTGGENSAAHDAGALPLLSHALLATWEHGLAGRMAVENYRASGGIEGAVAQTAERVYAQLTPAQQTAARRMFLRLVHVGEDTTDTRRRVDRAELFAATGDPREEETELVLDRYVEHRLITADIDTVAISHEALLLAWPRLRAWTDADRVGIRIHRQLTHAASAWRDGGREPDSLFRGGRLTTALEWVADHRDDLNALEAGFLEASVTQDRAERAKERRRIRRAYQLLAALVALLVAAGSLAGYSFQQRSEANRERQQAVSRQVAATANRLRDSDPALAAQLSLAAYRIAPTVEARSSLIASSWVPTVTRMVRPSGALQAAAVTQDGRLLAAAGASESDTAILLWNLAEPARPTLIGKPLKGHSRPVYAVAFSPDGRILATGSADKTVRLWDVRDPARPVSLGKPLVGAEDRVQAAEFSPDGSILAVSAADKAVRLWDVGDPKHPVSLGKPLTGATADLPSVAFRPDGRALAVADGGGAVRLWDLADPRRPRRAGAPLRIPSRVNVVAFTPDGDTLAAGGNDGLVRLWNVVDPARPAAMGAPLKAATGWVYTIAFSSDGRTAAVGNADNAVQLWDIADRKRIATLPHTEPVTVVAFRHHDRLLLTNSADGIARWWTVPGPAIPAAGKKITTVAFHPGGRFLAAAGTDVQLWDVAHRYQPVKVGAALTAPRGYDRMGGTVAVSPDGRTLAAGTRQGNAVVLWDITNPKRPLRLGAPLTGHTALIENVRFSPNGHTLAAGSDDGTVRLWNLSNPRRPRPLATLNPGAGAIYMVGFTPDSRRLAAATSEGTVPLWDVSHPRQPKPFGRPLLASPDFTYSVAFSPDGRTLAAGSADGTIALWEVHDHHTPTRRGRRLTGPDGYLVALAFSRDSRILAGGSGAGQTWLWDVTNRRQPEPLAVLDSAPDTIWTLAFHPDGHTLANASGGVKLGETDPRRVARLICSSAGSLISETEWRKHVPGSAYVRICG